LIEIPEVGHDHRDECRQRALGLRDNPGSDGGESGCQCAVECDGNGAIGNLSTKMGTNDDCQHTGWVGGVGGVRLLGGVGVVGFVGGWRRHGINVGEQARSGQWVCAATRMAEACAAWGIGTGAPAAGWPPERWRRSDKENQRQATCLGNPAPLDAEYTPHMRSGCSYFSDLPQKVFEKRFGERCIRCKHLGGLVL